MGEEERHLSGMDADTPRRGNNETGVAPSLRFRRHPLWSLLFGGVGALLAASPVVLRDPEIRAAAFFSVNPFTSTKFIVVTAVLVGAWIIWAPVVVRVLRSARTFEITADRLVATHQFTRRRNGIPWASIASVTQLSPSPAMAGARLQFNRIQLTDGTELLFSPHLGRYRQFVEELRGRVACRVFDPAPGWPGQS